MTIVKAKVVASSGHRLTAIYESQPVATEQCSCIHVWASEAMEFGLIDSVWTRSAPEEAAGDAARPIDVLGRRPRRPSASDFQTLSDPPACAVGLRCASPPRQRGPLGAPASPGAGVERARALQAGASPGSAAPEASRFERASVGASTRGRVERSLSEPRRICQRPPSRQ